MNTLSFKIITPDRTVYEDEVKQVTIPTSSGEITVLAHHTPLVSLLIVGEVRVEKPDGARLSFFVNQGIVEVRKDNALYLLTDLAQPASEINIEEAEKARAQAEKMLSKGDKLVKEDFAHFEGELARELAKIKIGSRQRG